MELVDKTADTLSSLKLASDFPDKKDIVKNVVDCILIDFSNMPNITQGELELVDRKEYIKKLNFYIEEY